jgi:hypothetical protein
MTDWRGYCDECGDEEEFELEEGALGWMFGHTMRTGHYETKKEQI